MFDLTVEQKKLQQRARELADKHMKSRAADIDRLEEYPWDNVAKLTEAGFMGMTIPKNYGGAGLTYFDAVLVIEQIARTCGISARTSPTCSSTSRTSRPRRRSTTTGRSSRIS